MPTTEQSLTNKSRKTYRGSMVLVAVLIALSLESLERTPMAAAQETVSEQELAARRARIRDYFQKRLQRLKIVTTTVTPSGQILDWIPPQSQTPDGKLAPPPAWVPESAVGPNADLAQTEVELYPHTRGPAGTVPIVRFDVEKYLAVTKIPPADPKDVLRGMYPPQPDRQTGNYYVGWRLEEPNWGSQGHINIWDTPGPTSPEASIAQLNISAGTHGTTLQTIEAGKIEKVPLTGDQRPHFFVYYTTNAYSNVGDWEGGYNIADKGFIQYLFSRAPNMVLTSSVSGGRQVDLGVTIYYDKPCDGCGGNWWVAFNSQWVGYYPYCKGGTDRPPCPDYPDPDNPNGPLLPGGELFSASGLRDGASRLDWYGEVHNPWAPTSTDMGNGIFPSSGSDGTAAYFRSLLYRHDRHLLSMTRALTTGSFYITDPNCYDGSGPQFNLGTGYPDRLWHNHFFYGGPGKEAPACR